VVAGVFHGKKVEMPESVFRSLAAFAKHQGSLFRRLSLSQNRRALYPGSVGRILVAGFRVATLENLSVDI